MTKTVEEVRRAAFEAAYLKHFGRYPDNWCDVISKYLNAHAQGAWWAWQSALDAVEIQLPERDAKGSGSPDSEMGASLEQYEAVAYNFALADCRAAIEQTGLGLRVL